MERFRLRDGEAQVRVDAPGRPRGVLVLAHGAGASMDTPLLETIACGVAAAGLCVVRFAFPYMERRREGKRSPPDRMPVLEARFREVVARLPRSLPLLVGGKSMGSRVAALVADDLKSAGVVALGYPFHPPKRPDTLRLAALAALRAPCLVLQGTRDPFGTPAEVAGYLLPESVAVRWIEDGDHDLAPRRRSGRTHAENLAEAVAAIVGFARAQGA